MRQKPLLGELRGDVLWLTLCTPGAEVNVFTREVAAELLDALRGLDERRVRAVVFRSGKSRSFVNGVGLMLAGTIKREQDADAATALVREAYRALRDCAVPTVAAIEGNCFGCGVELVLHCRYRVAVDTFDTHFRMTEVADYLFVPTFGATQDLPPLIGLEEATRFVLWGENVTARRAEEIGLVDRCFQRAGYEDDLGRFVESAADGAPRPARLPSRDATAENDRVEAMARARIQKLPPSYRDVHTAALELMAGAARKQGANAEDYEREAREAARSLVAAPCRGALPFFFIRQMGRTLAIAGSSADGVAFSTSHSDLSALAGELALRCEAPSGPSAGGAARAHIELVRYRSTELPDDLASRTGRVAVCDRLEGRRFEPSSGVTLYCPLRSVGVELAEVAFSGEKEDPTQRVLSAALANRSGFTVLRTRPAAFFIIDELIAAWCGPQVAYLQHGGDARDLARSLRSFGFTRFAGNWGDALGWDAFERIVRAGRPELVDAGIWLRALPTISTEDGVDDPSFSQALLVSLSGFATRMLATKAMVHPTAIDLAAREVVDFPLQHTSLCRYLSISRSAQLLDATPQMGHLVKNDDINALKEFVANGREYYHRIHRN